MGAAIRVVVPRRGHQKRELRPSADAYAAICRANALGPDDDFGEAAEYCPRLSPAGGLLMQLYLVRHGIAVDGGEAIPDGSRGLTDKGRRRFHKTARAFGKLGHRLDLILTSPLVRAVQTAEILAGATKHGEVAVLEELDPKFDVASLRAAVAKRAGKSGAIALVGHEPQLSLALAALSGASPADIVLKKGAIVRVDASKLSDTKPVDVRWWLNRRRAARSRDCRCRRKPQRSCARRRELNPARSASGSRERQVRASAPWRRH